MTKPQPYRFMWEQQFRNTTDLKLPTKAVGLLLATWTRADGSGAHPGHGRLASASGLGERSIRLHIAALLEAKWIEEDDSRPMDSGHRGRPAKVYRLRLPTDEYRQPTAGK